MYKTKKLISILLILAMIVCINHMPDSLQLSYAGETEDYIYYSYNDGVAFLEKYIGTATDVVIPETIDGLEVTGIDSAIFSERNDITSVTLPDNIIYISIEGLASNPDMTGIHVNETNAELSSVDGILFNKDKTEMLYYPPGKTETAYAVPDGVNVIRSGAFYNCDSLTSITIPASVTEIEHHRFDDCDNLTEFIVDENNLVFSSENGILFNKNKSTIQRYPQGKTDIEYVVPGSVGGIGRRAFADCDNLQKITLPDEFSHISLEAFYSCSNLKTIVMPTKIQSLSEGVFKDCSSLNSSITIPSGIDGIEAQLFEGCSSLTEIIIPDTISYIRGNAFSGCSSLTEISIPGSVTQLDSQAFSNCTSLKNIIFENNETSFLRLGDNIFENCPGLTTINLPCQTRIISNNTFSGNSSIAEINIDEKCNNFHSDSGIVFRKDALICYPAGKSDSSYTVPDTVTTIRNSAFSNATNLTEIIIPDSVTKLSAYAFSGCTGLTKAVIADSVVAINNTAFEGCDNVTIYANAGSPAESFAKEQGLAFSTLAEITPTPTVAPSETESPKPTETVSPEPTETATPEPVVFNLGDINKDGNIDAADALLVLKHAAKLSILEDTTSANVTKDETTDANDALLILKYAAKLINTL